MEGSESPERSGGRGGGGAAHLGVNKAHSAKISKVVKRSVIQPPKPQAPVYTIDKNDFRNIVQKLTGSTPSAPEAAPPATSASPPPVSTPPNPSRLQRARPPPLQSVQSFNKLVSNLTPITAIPPPSANFTAGAATGGGGNFAFRSTPRPVVFPYQTQFSPFQLPPPVNFNLSAAYSRPPPLMAPPPPPQPQFLSFSPLPSPSSQFGLQAFGGSQVPFSPGSIFPLSPSGHFPASPGSGQFPFSSF